MQDLYFAFLLWLEQFSTNFFLMNLCYQTVCNVQEKYHPLNYCVKIFQSFISAPRGLLFKKLKQHNFSLNALIKVPSWKVLCLGFFCRIQYRIVLKIWFIVLYDTLIFKDYCSLPIVFIQKNSMCDWNRNISQCSRLGSGKWLLHKYSKGSFVLHYCGELINSQEASKREQNYTRCGSGSYMYYFKHTGQQLW